MEYGYTLSMKPSPGIKPMYEFALACNFGVWRGLGSLVGRAANLMWGKGGGGNCEDR